MNADEVAVIEAVRIGTDQVAAAAKADLQIVARTAIVLGHDPILAIRGRADVLAAPMRHP